VDTAGIRAYLQSRLTYSKQANDTWRYDLLGQALDTPNFNNSTDVYIIIIDNITSLERQRDEEWKQMREIEYNVQCDVTNITTSHTCSICACI
jgi:hypothetical protein